MKFVMPQQNQGQIVEVSYACCADRIVRRIHDRSDRTTCYQSAPIDGDDWEWYETYEPVNGEPPITDDAWQAISAERVKRLGDAT